MKKKIGIVKKLMWRIYFFVIGIRIFDYFRARYTIGILGIVPHPYKLHRVQVQKWFPYSSFLRIGELPLKITTLTSSIIDIQYFSSNSTQNVDTNTQNTKPVKNGQISQTDFEEQQREKNNDHQVLIEANT